MEKLRSYLNGLDSTQQEEFAKRCGTTIGSLRTALSKGSSLGAELCVAIERESNNQVKRQDLRDNWREVWPELVTAA